MLTQGSFKTHLGAQLLLARAFIPLERFSTFTDAVSDPVFPEPALVMFSQRCDLARLHMHPGSVSLFGLKNFQAFPSFFLILLYGVLKI